MTSLPHRPYLAKARSAPPHGLKPGGRPGVMLELPGRSLPELTLKLTRCAYRRTLALQTD